MNSVTYKDGTVVTANSATESIIGSEIDITPMQLIGPSPDIPGASLRSDALRSVVQGGDVVLSATLSDALLIPDTSVSGFDSVLQATLMWQEQEPSASTEAKWRWSDRACGAATAARYRCRAGKRPWPRTGWASEDESDVDHRVDAQFRARRAPAGGQSSSPSRRRPVQIGGIPAVRGVSAWDKESQLVTSASPSQVPSTRTSRA